MKKRLLLLYFGHTDLIPTIAYLIGLEILNKDGGAGKVIEEVKEGDARGFKQAQYIDQYDLLWSRIILGASENTLSKPVSKF